MVAVLTSQPDEPADSASDGLASQVDEGKLRHAPVRAPKQNRKREDAAEGPGGLGYVISRDEELGESGNGTADHRGG